EESYERASYEPPGNPAEEALAAIWIGLLGHERVGRHDDFFALGGDSLISARVVAQARSAGLEISIQEVFLHPTLAALARCVRPLAADEFLDPALSLLAPIERRASTGPVPATFWREFRHFQSRADICDQDHVGIN